jgi:hypothetical protein
MIKMSFLCITRHGMNQEQKKSKNTFRKQNDYDKEGGERTDRCLMNSRYNVNAFALNVEC